MKNAPEWGVFLMEVLFSLRKEKDFFILYINKNGVFYLGNQENNSSGKTLFFPSSRVKMEARSFLE